MLNLVRFLDERAAASAKADRNAYAVDAMFWHVRLEKLEQKNNGGEKGKYLREACARCQQLGTKRDCSPEHLTHEVERLDGIYIAQLKREDSPSQTAAPNKR